MRVTAPLTAQATRIPSTHAMLFTSLNVAKLHRDLTYNDQACPVLILTAH